MSDQAALPKNKPKLTGCSGRWSDDEHQAFLLGLARHGRDWKRVALDVQTRTSNQVRSHAQKCFAKIPKPYYGKVSASVLLQAERIMADPAAAAAEVNETLRRLKDRYRELKEKQKTTLYPQDDETVLVAVGVLCSFVPNISTPGSIIESLSSERPAI